MLLESKSLSFKSSQATAAFAQRQCADCPFSSEAQLRTHASVLYDSMLVLMSALAASIISAAVMLPSSWEAKQEQGNV